VTANVAVIRFPGSNCESESLEAIERVGLNGKIMRWNEPVDLLDQFDGFFLPGGFSYQDRIRAGAVAARLPVLDLLIRRADAGTPILGICNGAQILVETGIVPGNRDGADGAHPVDVALAPNRSEVHEGYFTRWLFLGPGPAVDRCVFTRGISEPLPMPTAHAEGRFVSRDPEGQEALQSQTGLRYVLSDGPPAEAFPALPNGSSFGTAGLTNAAGNVLALMPHPDRALRLAQVPDWLPGPWGESRRSARSFAELEADGPGLAIFRGFAAALQPEGV